MTTLNFRYLFLSGGASELWGKYGGGVYVAIVNPSASARGLRVPPSSTLLPSVSSTSPPGASCRRESVLCLLWLRPGHPAPGNIRDRSPTTSKTLPRPVHIERASYAPRRGRNKCPGRRSSASSPGDTRGSPRCTGRGSQMFDPGYSAP